MKPKPAKAPILLTHKDSGERVAFFGLMSQHGEPRMVVFDERGELQALPLNQLVVHSYARRSPKTIVGSPRDGSAKGSRLARFTDRAKRAVSLGEEAAESNGTQPLDSARLLVGLLTEGNGVGVSVLRDSRKVDLAALQGHALAVDKEDLPAQRVYDHAYEVADSLAFHYVGTEVLLLALISLEGSASRRLLANAGVEEIALRTAVLEFLGRSN